MDLERGSVHGGNNIRRRKCVLMAASHLGGWMYDSSFTSSFSVRSRVAFCAISLAIMNRKEGEGIGGRDQQK